MKRALITGITGMDGSHLADLLLEKGYEVHGVVRRCSHPSTSRIAHILPRLVLHEGDMIDQASLSRIMADVVPDEVYNLAAQSFVATSWQQPVLTAEVTALGALRMLEALRTHAPAARFYQASSSEMFGNSQDRMQDEHTPFAPRSPYGASKVAAHHAAVNFRESYGFHISCGILFNHESERRGPEFVTRRITRQVAELANGLREKVVLGNLDAKRDWGYAPDFVRGMWLMLQQDRPGDYVLATGRAHSVRDFLSVALEEAGVDRSVDEVYEPDPSLLRPAELHCLIGAATKARAYLGWAESTDFRLLVRRMVEADLEGVTRSRSELVA